MLGMVLGVASLITVLAIMNGFAGELRGRILSLVPHGYVEPVDRGQLENWRALANTLEMQPQILALAPYISDKVIVAGPAQLRGAVLTAIEPSLEAGVSGIAAAMVHGSLTDLQAEPFSVVLGISLARALGVGPGDSVEVTIPRLTVTPLGTFPRSKRLRVTGLFQINAQPDGHQAYVSLQTGQRLFATGSAVDGLQVRTADLMTAPQQLAALAPVLPPGLVVRDWSQT
ncbi:MAG: ABC transporter permease, partial [Haliea sp.]